MNSPRLKNEILFQRIKRLVKTERRIGTAILECLYEIEQRKAYAELRYDGLFTYCVKELGFTEAQAFQRIQAMRAVKDMPELKSKIESGALSVSAISKVQNHFRKERKAGRIAPKNEKLELFRALENKTSREVEAKLAEVRGEELKTKLLVEMDSELEGLWKEVKDLAAHRSGGDEAEVLKILAREWLDRNDPLRKVKKAVTKEEGDRKSETHCPRRAVSGLIKVESRSSSAPHKASDPNSRIVSARLKREIWARDRGNCTRCGSKHALEIDHVLPYACGGKTEAGNLRLLCRSCNQFLAKRTFGVKVRRLRND